MSVLSKIVKKQPTLKIKELICLMYNNMDDLIADWENKILYYSSQIDELKSQLVNYQTLLEEKDNYINQLLSENEQLKVQIQNSQTQLVSPSYSSATSQPNLHPPPQRNPTPQVQPSKVNLPKISPLGTYTTDISLKKRQCPNCGASGFAIKEVDDKNRILSYIPRRIYAKKRVCTKCRFEF
jgi:chromosome segregation ATPase